APLSGVTADQPPISDHSQLLPLPLLLLLLLSGVCPFKTSNTVVSSAVDTATAAAVLCSSLAPTHYLSPLFYYHSMPQHTHTHFYWSCVCVRRVWETTLRGFAHVVCLSSPERCRTRSDQQVERVCLDPSR